MIKIYSSEKPDNKVLKSACKKLKIEQEGVSFVAYDKFLFGYLFILLIKENNVYLFGLDETNKKPGQYSKYNAKEIKGVSIDNSTYFNLHLKNGNHINLTSVVGALGSNKRLVKLINNEINKAR